MLAICSFLRPSPAPHNNPSLPPSTPSINNHKNSILPINRRNFFTAVLTLSTTHFVDFGLDSIFKPEAVARGLFQMPPVGLTNRCFLVRPGESEFESLGIINTNPVVKTSVDGGLSQRGKKQTLKAAFELKEMGTCEKGCWIWPSITQRA